MRIVVAGEPVAWARARRRGKRHFNSARHAEHMQHVRDAWTHPALSGPVEVRLRFFCGRPKSHSYTGRNSHKLRPDAPRFPQRVDVDNLAKLVLDALTGRAYQDDVQVVTVSATKSFGMPRTVIEVLPVDQGGPAS